MASVRITNDIRYYVRNKFDEMFRTRIQNKTAELSELGIGNVCYERSVSAEARKLVEKLNADPDGQWIEPTQIYSIQMTYKGLDGKDKTVTFTVPFKPPVALPLRLAGRYGTKFILEPDMAPYEHAKKIWLEIDQLNDELNTLKATIVDGVLQQCSTLRQVLEVWPTALDFMPESARAQHYAKAEKRTTNPAADIQIDDSVKVALMKARMSQGN